MHSLRDLSTSLFVALTVASTAFAAPAADSEPDRSAGVASPERSSSDSPRAAESAGPPLAPGERRALPDYDGRGPDPRPRGSGWLWLPRLVLSPLYLTSEFAVRRPLGYVVTTAERHKWPSLLVDFFTFGPRRQAGLVPTALIDFGFRPSIGALFFWNDAGFDGNDLRLRAAWGGPDWRTFSVSDFIDVTPGQELDLRLRSSTRPDWVFHGLGPKSGSRRARFRENRITAAAEYRWKGWRSSEVVSSVGIQDSEFDATSRCCGSRSVSDEVTRGRYPLPDGMAGYTALKSSLAVSIDSRPRRKLDDPAPGSDFVSPPGSGYRLAGRVAHGADLRAPDDPARTRYEWLRYGATLGGYVDLTGQQRVLGLEVIVDFADPLLEGSGIPFTELVSLGGKRPMRGFLAGRLRDRSAFVAHLEYQYPVWAWLDGTVHYDLGNVFGPGLEGIDAKLLRQSFGMGIRANNRREHALELLIGAGTRTFEDGGGVEALRLVLGASSGF